MGHVKKHRDGSWPAAPERAYASGAVRRTLVGADDGARQIELRHFALPAGGSSTAERHAHEHAIVITSGRGTVRLGADRHEVAAGDVVFVAAAELHQLCSAEDEGLAFLCTAPVQRRRGAEAPRGGLTPR
jgi:quercetin dioxygenase-like cupin family protein